MSVEHSGSNPATAATGAGLAQPVIGRTIAESTPAWPTPVSAPAGAPNVLIVLFDDVGFSDFGCYGSPIRTPTIDSIAAEGLRLSGFHTTAMCSTTRAAMLTGRNHHAVGVGCLANFDSGYPGYRGKISRNSATLAEMLRPHGYRNYMLGKWHVTPLTESGPTGPFDGWPLGRGFDRFYGFLDAETDQYAPELVRDNTHVDPPGTFADGYHLSADLVDEAIRLLADHHADRPELPWLTWLALGACHAPHQAPAEMIRAYDPVFDKGWDHERESRLARMKSLGIVPADAGLAPRNDGVRPWNEIDTDARRVYTRLQAAYAAMLEHADQQLARLMAFLEASGQRENTLVIVLSDNGASQEGGLHGFVNALGPFNQRPEPMAEKLARIDDIGGPDTHTNFPLGWAMAANTPLKRYKQNTHGGGIRDPLVLSWPARIPDAGAIRSPFCHVSDLVPTVLELIGIDAPAQIDGRPCDALTGESFAPMLLGQPWQRERAQYFEMFGHRGLWHEGWKAVAYHPPGTAFDGDRWELYHLDEDFSECHDLAEREPQRLRAMIDQWWREAEANQVLPLDDRFGPRFAENAARFHGARTRVVFHAGVGHVPTDVAPDVRHRSYRLEADVTMATGRESGVLIAHGDATSGYALYVRDGHLHHVLNIGGERVRVSSSHPIGPGDHLLAVQVRRAPPGEPPRPGLARPVGRARFTLTIDGQACGEVETTLGFATLISPGPAWTSVATGAVRSMTTRLPSSSRVACARWCSTPVSKNRSMAICSVARRWPGSRRAREVGHNAGAAHQPIAP
ncbi:MAG: sulfatase-like hydrolase/transferase [Burkholderiaceae bacterium]